MFQQICRRLCLMSILTLVLGSTAVANEGEAITLRYNFKEGQVVRYQVSMHDDYKIQVGTAIDEPYSHQESGKFYRVKKVNPDGSAVLELTIEEINLEIFQNGEKLKFDSRKAPDGERPQLFLALEALVGKPHLQVTVTNRGTVSEYKPLVNQDQVPNDPGSAAFDVLFALPEDPISVGGTWKDDYTVNIAVEGSPMLRKAVKMQRLFTLTALNDGLATIDVKVRTLSSIDGASEEMQMLRRKPQGKVVIDTKRGLLLSKELAQQNSVANFDGGASLIEFKQLQKESLRETKASNQR